VLKLKPDCRYGAEGGEAMERLINHVLSRRELDKIIREFLRRNDFCDKVKLYKEIKQTVRKFRDAVAEGRKEKD